MLIDESNSDSCLLKISKKILTIAFAKAKAG